MGKGNWFPTTPIHQGDYDLAYVEVEDVCNDVPRMDALYEGFYDDLAFVLPNSFRFLTKREWVDKSTIILFANQLLMVVADTDGDYWHQGIAVVAREDAPAFAQARIGECADKLWKGLAKLGYMLSRRTGGYTSAAFDPLAVEMATT